MLWPHWYTGRTHRIHRRMLLAVDALATLSLWLLTWAGMTMVPDRVVIVPLPSQKTTGWDRWDSCLLHECMHTGSGIVPLSRQQFW
jgi:hypothetical protein